MLPAANGQLRQVGLVYPASRLHLVRAAYLAEILAGIVHQCDYGHIDLQILSFMHAGQRVPVPPHETAVRVDGIILLGIFNDAYIGAFAGEEIPLVVVDGRCGVAGVHSIAPDNALAVDQVMDHLHGLGHRRIAYLDMHSFDAVAGAWIDSPTTRQRREAYLAAMGRLGLESHRSVFLYGDDPREPIGLVARRLLDEPEPPTAVLAFDANVAGLLCEALCSGGCNVPKDISVAGVVGPGPLASAGGLVVTGCRAPFQEMGERAMQALMRQAAGGSAGAATLECVGADLLVGTTTARPRSSTKYNDRGQSGDGLRATGRTGTDGCRVSNGEDGTRDAGRGANDNGHDFGCCAAGDRTATTCRSRVRLTARATTTDKSRVLSPEC